VAFHLFCDAFALGPGRQFVPHIRTQRYDPPPGTKPDDGPEADLVSSIVQDAEGSP
jgi:hypothetical protein